MHTRRRRTRLPKLNRHGKPHGVPPVLRPEAPEIKQAWLVRWLRFSEDVAAWQGIRLKCEEVKQQIAALREQLADACPITQTAKTLAEGLVLAHVAS